MTFSILSLINALSPKDLGSHKLARDIPYGEGLRHRLDIYAPRRRERPLPVVFFIYGGSWSDGDRHNYDFAGRAIAAQGFITVIADYRLVPEVEFPGFLEDGAKALAWVAENIHHFGGDPARLALMGHSAGAYNAAMLALDAPYLAEAGMTRPIACVVGLSGPYDFFPFDGPISLRIFGAVRQPATTQPINHADGGAPPMFLASGDLDQVVYPRNTVALAARLRDSGVVVEERHYAKLGHPHTLLALGIPARWIAPVLADVAQFLHAWLDPV